MLAAGDLRERVSLQEPSQASDGQGNTVDGWTPRGDRWARYLMRPGSEAFTAARLEGREPLSIIIRFDALTTLVNNAWRVVDRRSGKVYAIRHAEDLDRRRQWITLTCDLAS